MHGVDTTRNSGIHEQKFITGSAHDAIFKLTYAPDWKLCCPALNVRFGMVKFHGACCVITTWAGGSVAINTKDSIERWLSNSTRNQLEVKKLTS